MYVLLYLCCYVVLYVVAYFFMAGLMSVCRHLVVPRNVLHLFIYLVSWLVM